MGLVSSRMDRTKEMWQARQKPITVDGEGQTRVLAATFLQNENKESFAWAFSKFACSFMKRATIFTDQDLVMGQALMMECHNMEHACSMLLSHMEEFLQTHQAAVC